MIEPPEAAESLMDVGKECDVCGRNIGLFPVAEVCTYCRPHETEFGTIIGIEYSPVGTMEKKRIANSSINIDEDGTVNFVKGRHKDIIFLNDAPSIEEGDNPATIWLMSEWFPPYEYEIYFK